ncbi:MAG: primosomal protein N' [Lachnospiraceae bacterium]|nr:primosomal protein N' [Lachnospiraceae bacterium]
MKKNFAEIIVDISAESLDRPFTYRVPEELAERIQIGSVVSIPFGSSKKPIRGYVVGFAEQTTLAPETVKPLKELLTDEETVEARLVRLAVWMSRNCGSTMIQALRTVVPIRRKYRAVVSRTVSIADPAAAGDALAEAERKHYAAKARVLRCLLEEQTMDLAKLERAASVPLSVVRKLADEGILQIDSSEELRLVLKEAEKLPPDIPSPEQQSVIEAIRSEWNANGRPVLINGVTGSGKTVVYTELAADMLQQGKQVIILIPEIALTKQTVMRFVKRFGDKVSFLHSRLSGGERYDQMKAARQGAVSVMVGPRSALFTPFPNLGLIVVDEEHEDTYQSESVPRYDARDTAVKRAELEGAHVILGSATPSVLSARRAETGTYLGLILASRFGGSRLPETEIVDMRAELQNGNRSIFSMSLHRGIEEALASGGQIMLFLNRRGYSGTWTCRSCGSVLRCPHCDVSLTHHRSGRMICHYCGYETPVPKVCPECGSAQIGGLAIGTEQIEELLKKDFPQAGILRMDADTTAGKEGFESILSSFAAHKADILIGTQMIVKGHDFPAVTLVGVLCADMSLNADNYRSSEQTFQLITQVVGRAGRGERPGRAVIQTYNPDHFAVTAAAAQDYRTFYREEMSFRTLMEYPPAGYMTAILGSAYDEALLTQGMHYLRAFIDRIDPRGVLRTIGPAPEAIGKLKDRYRQVIYIRNADREKLILAKDRIEEYIALNSGFSKIRIQFDFNR